MCSLATKATEYLCRALSLEVENLVEHFAMIVMYPYNPLLYLPDIRALLPDGSEIFVTVEGIVPNTYDPIIAVCHAVVNNLTQWHEDLYCDLDKLFVYESL